MKKAVRDAVCKSNKNVDV